MHRRLLAAVARAFAFLDETSVLVTEFDGRFLQLNLAGGRRIDIEGMPTASRCQ